MIVNRLIRQSNVNPKSNIVSLGSGSIRRYSPKIFNTFKVGGSGARRMIFDGQVIINNKIGFCVCAPAKKSVLLPLYLSMIWWQLARQWFNAFQVFRSWLHSMFLCKRETKIARKIRIVLIPQNKLEIHSMFMS